MKCENTFLNTYLKLGRAKNNSYGMDLYASYCESIDRLKYTSIQVCKYEASHMQTRRYPCSHARAHVHVSMPTCKCICTCIQTYMCMQHVTLTRANVQQKCTYTYACTLCRFDCKSRGSSSCRSLPCSQFL